MDEHEREPDERAPDERAPDEYERGPEEPAGRILAAGPNERDDGGWLWWEAPTWPQRPDLPAPPPRRRSRSVLATVLAALVLLASGVGIGWGFTRSGSGSSSGFLGRLPGSNGSTDAGANVRAVAAKVDPAVVDINTFVDSSPFGRGSGATLPLGAGTGMILTSSGLVLTNNHVIDGANLVKVTIAGRSGQAVARVVGADPQDDVALLQVQGVSGLPAVTLADSSTLKQGQAIVAIGNAFGRGGTPSAAQGTVTGLGRSISVSDDHGGTENLHRLIQIDADIHPGDSGGPVVNSSGQVVGMITASARNESSNGATVGFAIGSNAALSVVDKIRAGQGGGPIIIGRAGFLGVEVKDLDPQTASRLGLKVSSGALVLTVVPGTPAAAAGIPQDAVITAVDGQRVSSAEALGPALHAHKPGDQVDVTWVEPSGAQHTATVTLIRGPAV